jgi:hypothetical protein
LLLTSDLTDLLGESGEDDDKVDDEAEDDNEVDSSDGDEETAKQGYPHQTTTVHETRHKTKKVFVPVYVPDKEKKKSLYLLFLSFNVDIDSTK